MNSDPQVFINAEISENIYDTETINVKHQVDPLFNSGFWQSSWWRRWGQNFKAVNVMVKDNNVVVCQLPLYIDRISFKKNIPVTRLQFIGTNYQNITTPRSEYLGFICATGAQSYLWLALEKLTMLTWDEFIARDIVRGDETDVLLNQWAHQNSWKVRVIHTDIAYFIDTTKCFEVYKDKLSPSTRLKLINRRKLLKCLGSVDIENYYPDRVPEFFKLLEKFHHHRWGDVFSESTVSFHKEIIGNCNEFGLGVDLSVLIVNGKCESVIFNYLLGGRVYNISSGFNEQFHKKIAIGTLHLGYIIEKSFVNPAINKFDFLAGNGKKTNYKKSLATGEVELYSIKVVRSKKMKTLYFLKDLFDNKIKTM